MKPRHPDINRVNKPPPKPLWEELNDPSLDFFVDGLEETAEPCDNPKCDNGIVKVHDNYGRWQYQGTCATCNGLGMKPRDPDPPWTEFCGRCFGEKEIMSFNAEDGYAACPDCAEPADG